MMRSTVNDVSSDSPTRGAVCHDWSHSGSDSFDYPAWCVLYFGTTLNWLAMVVFACSRAIFSAIDLCWTVGTDLYGAFTRLAHAARSYSCNRPPRRSRRFSVIGGVPVHAGAEGRPFGGAKSRLR